MKCLLTASAFFLLSGLFAQVNYSAGSIPETLKKNAHSVIRSERISYDLKSPARGVYSVDRVITLLDDYEKDELIIDFYTDKFHSLGDVSVKIYDEDGSVVHKYNKKDLTYTASAYDLVPNGKIYFLRLNAPGYPLTIETHYTIHYDGIFTFPAYRIQQPLQSVEQTEYVFKLPADMQVRYEARNTDIKPVINDESSKYRTYTWSASSLPARPYDEASGPVDNSFPVIVLAPTKFDLDGYEGDMTSWKNLGLWYNNLVKNDNKLSPENQKVITDLVRDAKNDREKIAILYNYLQNNFRYVSIQLGIGGLKPFSADFVHKTKYGDCKGLSNYMEACLNAINIKSYSAWIRSGVGSHLKSNPDFPYDHFDHQILCVPMQPDSVWLECTSPVSEPGFLGSFTDDRDALLLTENGGVLVQTPKNTASRNNFTSTTRINLNEDGSGTALVKIVATGDFRSDFLYGFNDRQKDDQKSFLINQLGFLQPDKFDVTAGKSNKEASLMINMQIEKIPDFTAGNKQFLNPRIYKLWKKNLPKAETRTQDYYFPYPFTKIDTTVYKLPEGYRPETMPKSKEISFEYGSFSSSCRFDESQGAIITTARLVLNEYMIPAAKFAATKKFFADVLAEYSEKVVIKHL